MGLNYARLLVEVKMGENLPKGIMFCNEKGMLVTQKVTYDQHPSICKACHKYGHIEEVCQKKKAEVHKKDTKKVEVTNVPIKEEKGESKKADTDQYHEVHRDRYWGVSRLGLFQSKLQNLQLH